MIICKKFTSTSLQTLLDCIYSFLKVTPSLLHEFDYQASIYKIITSEKNKNWKIFYLAAKL
jgi:hypothetical protein